MALSSPDNWTTAPNACNLEGIPPEIITQFFLSYHDTLEKGSIDRGLQNICLTCKDWCDIVYSAPELWCTLDITIQSRSVPESSLAKVEAWLHRSREHPLKIYYAVDNPGPAINPWNRNLFLQIFKLLVDQIHRWSDVTFSFPPTILETFPSVMDISAPMLESLSIVSFPVLPIHTRWILILLARSPKLHSFHDKRSEIQAMPLRKLPLSQLTDIDIHYPNPPPYILDLIVDMPLLETCHFVLGTEPPFYISRLTPVFYAPTSLRITLSHPSAISPLFFSRLQAPALQEIDIRILPNSHLTYGNLSIIFNNTHAQITSFTLRNMFVEASNFLLCLRLLSPTLTRLEILAESLSSHHYNMAENFSEEIIAALMYDPDIPVEEILCPKLEALALERCVTESDQKLGRMIESRWRAHHPKSNYHPIPKYPPPPISEFRFFRVVFRYHSHDVDARILQMLRGEGLGGATEFGHARLSRRIPVFSACK